MGEISKSHSEVEKKKSTNKKFLIVVIVLILLVLLTALGGWYWYTQNKNQASGQGCSSTASKSLLQQAISDIGNGQGLKPLADKITQLKNFQNDPNCVYILVAYYSQNNDAANTQKYAQILHSFPSNKQPSDLLVKSTNDKLQALKSNIDFLINFNTQSVKNFVGTGTPQK
ncbi:hypothetical protein HYX70_02425 [Candidatus Saccharibacteria bacterium]|nr:hypothetical protein [Candidatus Saccharibacteria bacterium]